ncbi:OLC1v1034212C1 [Oldenlandia corymbosa var. corymbosa]|uniref:OLC1v1034212C1 n=1 Tax=Oldenlandia corymbosa var. corymbosa TaxID=529605 RepID=A0AAV1CQ91_OLDCO|nr:OLC1v1034212C1 [Oldenlandia corymbosa var. corymbosa]
MNLAASPVVPAVLTEIKAALFQGFNSLNHLKHVHGRLLRNGLDQNNYLLNLLLQSSFKFRNPSYTKLIFHQARQPNIFLWNTIIRGFVSRDYFHEAVEFFYSMREQGTLPNSYTFPFLLKAATRLVDFELGYKLHTLVVKVGLDYDVFVNTGLVCLYVKCSCLTDAEKLFDDIPEKNATSWTAIISGYIELRKYGKAIDLFWRSFSLGLRPDSFTLVRVLSACTLSGDLTSGEQVHKYWLESGMGRNVFVSTSLVDMYTKLGCMEKARVVFDEMSEKGIVTWSSMIQGYAANGLPERALELFHQMVREDLKPDRYAIVGVLSACARLGASEVGEWACKLMDMNEFFSNPVMGTALIDMYSKCGKVVEAWDIFLQMTVKDTVIWNAIISGLAMGGHVNSAFSCFALMEKMGMKPEENTFLGLLCGCSHAGLVNDGRRYFYNMSRIYSVQPTIEHYGCMVDLLGRAGLLDEARLLIQNMPMKANTVVWGALLGGCRIHRDTQLAEYVLKRMIELEPWNSSNYVLLSNIYSANNKWEDSERIRSVIKGQGIQKVPAYSWMEVNGIVHEFLVGDTTHPMSDKIYTKLREMNKDLRAAGYVPSKEFVLFDIEAEEKEQLIGYHSEKLALAFGLISTGPNDVIRITKNLRVCGDCHVTFKLISKITGRVIMVRDTNRFHCFRDGSCSCNDYW